MFFNVLPIVYAEAVFAFDGDTWALIEMGLGILLEMLFTAQMTLGLHIEAL
jgi:hypothetical protein